LTDEQDHQPEETQNPALTETPADDLAPGSMRERLTIALVECGSTLEESVRLEIAAAISKPSPVEMIVAVYSVIATAPEGGSAPSATCGKVLLSRAIECADMIAAHSWFGKGDEAALFAATARAQLAS
jgi:hypothetical protein